ncbi:MAG: hypothetical protein ABI654_14940 [Betaproteobacteria bacterium]
MRNIIALLLALVAPIVLAQRSPSCESAPANAQVVVPPELRKWITIDCGDAGHVISPARGYFWRANSGGQPLKFPALGPAGVPVNEVKGVLMVKSPTGTYAPLEGGALISPHDAFFAKSRIFPITDDFLVGTNDAVSRQNGYAGPYRKGYLYDLLSNQGFEYRLFVLLVNDEPHMIDVVFQTTDKYRRITVLVTRQ